MNSNLKSTMLPLLAVFALAIIASVTCAAGRLNIVQEPAANGAGHSSFKTGDINRVVFQSAEDCNLKLETWDKPEAEISWTVEVVAGSKEAKDRAAGVAVPLNVTARKEGDAINIKVVADKGRFKVQSRDTSNNNSKVSLLDTTTGLIWQVNVQARLPSVTKIDTTGFKGWINLSGEATGKRS